MRGEMTNTEGSQLKFKQASWYSFLAEGASWEASVSDAWLSPDSASYWRLASPIPPCLLSEVAPVGRAHALPPGLGWNGS